MVWLDLVTIKVQYDRIASLVNAFEFYYIRECFEGAANFARRSPWPMVNILRSSQVRSAQKGIPTGQVYRQNEDRLNSVGTSTLQV